MRAIQTVLVFSIGMLLLVGLFGHSNVVQADISWTSRQRIPGSEDEARTIFLLADQNQGVYAFFSQPLIGNESITGIIQSRWSLNSGWSMSSDIILPPESGAANVQGAYLDNKGVIHLIYICCHADQMPNVYYTKASAVDSYKANAWSAPKIIGSTAITPNNAAFLGDDQGNLYVLYAGNLQGPGIYFTQSKNNGGTWTSPVSLDFTDDHQDFPYQIRVTNDDKNRLHAVWSINRPDGMGKSITYMRLDSDHTTWSQPLKLAGVSDAFNAVTHPGIASLGNELWVIYNGWPVVGTTGRMMRHSSDYGLTWDQPIRPFPSKGEYGPPSFVIDSSKTLHVFYGDRELGLNLWHNTWQAGHWGEPEPIASRSEANLFPNGPNGFHPNSPKAVISQGNIILLSWITDPGVALNGIWYSVKQLDTPRLPTIVSAKNATAATLNPVTASASTQNSILPTFTQAAASTKALATALPLQKKPEIDPTSSLVIGVIPILVLIAVIVVRSNIKKRR